jgi:NAD(P)-dependent dehydrogenase (short-subunit alcohol dehydrogenase family)
MPGGRRPGPGRTPDMTNQAAVAEFARRTIQRFGRIDIWVNNAGVYLLGSLEATRPKPSGGCSRPIFFGYVHGAAHFRGQGHGVLINNASVYSHIGAPWLAAYVSSKFSPSAGSPRRYVKS